MINNLLISKQKVFKLIDYIPNADKETTITLKYHATCFPFLDAVKKERKENGNIDESKLIELIAEFLVVDWSGFMYLKDDEEVEIPFSTENALLFLKNSELMSDIISGIVMTSVSFETKELIEFNYTSKN